MSLLTYLESSSYCQTWFITSSARIDEFAPVLPRSGAHGREVPNSASDGAELPSASSETTSTPDYIRFLRRIRIFSDRAKASDREPSTDGNHTYGSDDSSHPWPIARSLYVGNLPRPSPNHLEDGLRQLFEREPGFRRLGFQQKRHGALCLVEFANIADASRALHDLEGSMLNGLVPDEGISLVFVQEVLRIRALNPPPQPSYLVADADL